jgi:hypothetical protein
MVLSNGRKEVGTDQEMDVERRWELIRKWILQYAIL